MDVDDHSGNTDLGTTAAAKLVTPRMPSYDEPEVPTTETTPTRLRKEITKLKSDIAEQEEVLKSHQKLFSEGTASLGAMSPEALTVLSNISMMVSSESENLNSRRGRLSMLEEKLAIAEKAMELRAQRMLCLLSFCLM
jgi:hypothetical protein